MKASVLGNKLPSISPKTLPKSFLVLSYSFLLFFFGVLCRPAAFLVADKTALLVVVWFGCGIKEATLVLV
jgi:hypothetical protein